MVVFTFLLKNTIEITLKITHYFCYFDHEIDEGVILAFRQEACVRAVLRVSLPFADDECKYLISDENTGEQLKLEKRELTINFEKPRIAKLL